MRAELSRLAIGLLSVVIVSGTHPARAENIDSWAGPTSELRWAIKSGIELLKEKRLIEFSERFVASIDLAEWDARGRFDAMSLNAQNSGARTGVSTEIERLQKILEKIQDLDPRFDDDEAIATYDLFGTEGGTLGSTFVLRKINGKWYLPVR